MVATIAQPLTKQEVVAYVGQNAKNYGLDPAAVLAVAEHEGLNRGPDSGLPMKWWLGGEAGWSFGPPSWYQGNAANPGAGYKIVQEQGSPDAAARWAWTPAGIDYWLYTLSTSRTPQGQTPQGKTGWDAIDSIVRGFERPRADLVGGEITDAWKDYGRFLQQIQVPLPGLPGPIPLPGMPGQTQPGQLPTPTDPQTTPAPSTPAVSSPFSMHIFDLPTGPVNLTLPWDFSGILLFLAAIFAILIGALMWDKSRNVIVKSGETAGMAAELA